MWTFVEPLHLGDHALSVIAIGRQRFRLESEQHDGELTAHAYIVEDAPVNVPKEAKKVCAFKAPKKCAQYFQQNMAYWPPAVWRSYDSWALMRALQVC